MLGLQERRFAALLLPARNYAIDVGSERKPVDVEFLNGDVSASALFGFLHNLCQQKPRKCMRVHKQNASHHQQQQ